MKSVLVVEDDQAVAETIRMILEDSYAVSLCDSTGEMPEGTDPSLVITDLLSGSGYDSDAAVRTVRETRSRTGAPVLVLTAHSAASADCRLAGEANAVLTKPFHIDELLAMVERLAV